MPPTEAPHEGYALALDEARRMIEIQEHEVIELRARAGGLVATAAIMTSFFGSRVLDRHAIGIATWAAIAFLIGLGICSLGVLWPRRASERAMSPRTLIFAYLEPPGTEPLSLHLMQRDLALRLDGNAAVNRHRLRLSTLLVRVGAICLIAEAMAWVVALIVGT